MNYQELRDEIKAAMKARDKVRLDTLRNIKKVFLIRPYHQNLETHL